MKSLFVKLPQYLLYLLVLTVNTAVLAASSKPNDKLTDVKQAISEQKKAISITKERRTKLEQQLKEDDLAIAKVAKTIEVTKQDYQQTKEKLSELSQEKQTLTTEKKHQEKLLAQQLRAAYSSGHHDYIKLLLNQEQPAKIQRTVTYYQYLNKARIAEIEHFQQTLSKLLQVTTEYNEQAKQLDQIQRVQIAQQKKLKENKSKRTQTIKALGKDLISKQEQLAKLEAEEKNLQQALDRLAALAKAELEMKGLSKLKRKLRWPVKGKIAHRFGSKKQDYLKWKGVLISAPIGRQVKTIHSGKILFADWLKGYGLVTVIDHGEGYMSLYGHNQTLLKSVGDRVETGEPIALVGQSGGQQQSGLYFEIRYQGKAVNPKTWCR